MPVDIHEEIGRVLAVRKEERNRKRSSQRQLETIFFAARRLESEKRSAFLDESCGKDARLRNRAAALLDSETLDELIADHTLTIQQILDISRDIAYELNWLHAEGFTHGNLRADNIAVFGPRHVELLNCDAFMPAAETNPNVDVRVDIIAFGVLLEEMIGNREAAEAVRQIAAKAANLDRRYRYPSVMEMCAAIERLCQPPYRKNARRELIIWSVILVALLAIYVWLRAALNLD